MAFFSSTGRLHNVVARGTGSGFKSPPCLFQAVCPWASERPSLGPEAPLGRMGIIRGSSSMTDLGLEESETYAILEDLIKKKKLIMNNN